MERKNITIREGQSEWIEQERINLSQLVQETIDQEMGPTAEELAATYRENADMLPKRTSSGSTFLGKRTTISVDPQPTNERTSG